MCTTGVTVVSGYAFIHDVERGNVRDAIGSGANTSTGITMLVTSNPYALVAPARLPFPITAAVGLPRKPVGDKPPPKPAGPFANFIMGDDPGAIRKGVGYTGGYIVTAGGVLVVELERTNFVDQPVIMLRNVSQPAAITNTTCGITKTTKNPISQKCQTRACQIRRGWQLARRVVPVCELPTQWRQRGSRQPQRWQTHPASARNTSPFSGSPILPAAVVVDPVRWICVVVQPWYVSTYPDSRVSEVVELPDCGSGLCR
jgi:hypothetical protein